MTELLQIQEFIQQIAEGISLALEIDTQVIDCYCNRLAGTVFHPLPAVGGIVRDVLKTGKPRICSSPGSEPECHQCDKRSNCDEKGFIHYPIFYDDKVVGVMGIICFEPIQAKKISDDKYRLSSFVERMCEIIQLKLKEYDVAQKEKAILQEALLQNQILNQTLSQISDGYLFVNMDGTIRNYNTQALRILGITAEAVKQESIQSLIPDLDLSGLFVKKLHTIYERVLIHNKEYGVFVSFFYNDKEQTGCSINFKMIDSLPTHVEASGKSISDGTTSLDDYLGNCSEIMKVKKMAKKAATQPVNVLISGENGTGKETLARAIHGSGSRAQKPFVTVDCKAFSPEYMDEELFGGPELENGAVSGEKALGKLELASSGTIFFNDIEQMPMYSQIRLFSCISNGYFQKTGSNRKVFIDVRIIAATSQPPKDLISQNAFFEELYYCLNGIPIQLPPLRSRGDDIMLYANYMLKKYERYFTNKSLRFDKKVAMYFSHYAWPGNLHEMDNVVQYMLSLYTGKGQLLTAGNLPTNIKESFDHFDIPKKIEQNVQTDTGGSLRSIENQTITDLIEQYGNTTAGKKIVAQKLGISLATLYRRLRENK